MKTHWHQAETGFSANLLLSVFVAFLTICLTSQAANSSVSLQWDASPSSNVTNYTVYYGKTSGNYSSTNNVGTNLTAGISNLTVGTTYNFVVTAQDSVGLESDPSQEIRYTGGNTWPTISTIADRGVFPNSSPITNQFSVGDDETLVGNLTLSKGSSNPTLIPTANIVFGGSGANRTVTVTPAIGKTGTATITVSVSDGELTTTTNFMVMVAAAISPPTVQITSPVFGTMVYEGSSVQLTATATSPASVVKVEFYEGVTKLGEDSTAPYQLNVSNLPAGVHSYMALVIDSLNRTNTSAAVSLSVWVIPVSSVPAVYLASPMNGRSYVGPTNIVLSAEASSAGSSITRVEFYEGETKLGEAAASPYVITVSNVLAGTHTYMAKAFAASGTTNVSIPITVSVGFIVSASAPLPTVAKVIVTNGTAVIQGSVNNRLKVAQVAYAINNEPFRVASGTTNWLIQANLIPGTNKVLLVGIDHQGKSSVTNFRTLFYVVTNGITLRTNGGGTISGTINRHVLEVGRGYQLVAVARPGNLFSNWTAGAVVMGTNAVLNFQMISNLVLQANFVTNNFMARKGVYTGLAYDTNNVTFGNAGFFRLTLSGRGAFSGVTLLAGGVHPFTGRFWVDGRATVRIARNGKAALTNQLTIDLVGNSGISGTMSDGAFTVPLQADKAAFAQANPAPYAGRYTMIVPGTGGVAGDGVGAVNMGPLGTAVLGGALADGTVITRTAPVSGAGWWPLYVPLYTGKGMVISWVQFDTNGTKSLHGDAVWTKNPVPGKYYTNGFTLLTSVDGGQYVAPAVGPTNRVLELTSGTVTLTGGNLAAAITDSVVLTNNNLFVITGTNGLKLTINPANGMVNGSFTHPETKKLTAIKAVVQQAQTNIQGFFLGTNLSGRILLKP